MKFKIPCPDCGLTLNASDELVGKKAKCPSCGGVVLVTAPEVQGEEGLEFIDDVTIEERVVLEDNLDEPMVEQSKPSSRKSDGGTKACPMCGERIKTVALICRFCGEDLGASESRRGEGVWRDGGQLVMLKKADLPARCVKTNEPTDRTLRRQLYWHEPALFLLVFLGLCVYVIVALIVRKSADIDVGLSPQGFRSRRWGIAIGWLSFLLGAFVFFVGVANSNARNPNDAWWIACMVGLVGGLIGIIVGVVKSRVVVATRITNDHVWLKGVHPDYLAMLPAWSER